MSPPFESSVEALMRQLEHQQESIERSMRSVAAVTATATSPDRAVTVTLDHSGAVTDLTFAGGRYRSMAPAELSLAVIDVIGRAQAELRDRLADAYQGLVPGSLDVREVISGDFDVAKVMRDLVEERVEAHDSMFTTLQAMRSGGE